MYKNINLGKFDIVSEFLKFMYNAQTKLFQNPKIP